MAVRPVRAVSSRELSARLFSIINDSRRKDAPISSFDLVTETESSRVEAEQDISSESGT